MTHSILDLQSAARRCFNYFNRHFDPRTGAPYMWTYLLTDPPKLVHDGWDLVEEAGRSLEALVPLRVMTGADDGLARELALCDRLLSLFNDADGFFYRPACAYSDRVADVYDQSSVMLGLVMRCLADDDARCREIVERNLEALDRLVTWDGDDFARFPCVAVVDGRPLGASDRRVVETDNPAQVDEVWMGRFIQPLVTLARVTGRERPLVFARALARDIVFRSGRYGPDGNFSRARTPRDTLWSNGHFHSRSHTLAGILRVALATGDRELVEWSEMTFRWALTQGTSFGWFPEFVGRDDVPAEGCETCIITDMLDAAVLLAKSGRSEYWEAADRMWRNQLLEQQLRDVSWVRATRTQPDTEIETFDDAAARAVGGFAGWGGPNDLISDYVDPFFASLDPTQDHRRTLMGCCCAGGARGLYLAWHRALDETSDGVTVNFALTRDSRSAAVRSHEPHDGLVDVTMRCDGVLRFRVPGDPASKDVSVRCDRGGLRASWHGPLLEIDGLRRGDVVGVRYPLRDRAETVRVNGKDYEVTWRGNTVVGVRPQGTHCPLYIRELGADADAATSDTAPVPENEIDW